MKAYKTAKNQQIKGFTLIELLIVIAIIGILSALLMANYIGIRQRGRDVQRKADLRQIQTALEFYRTDSGGYRIVTSSPYRLNSTSCPTSSSLSNAGTVYMQKISCDPRGATYYNGGDYYYYSDGTTYTLSTCLENAADKDLNTQTTSPGGSGTCSSGLYFVLKNP